jgi:hypothetical protein
MTQIAPFFFDGNQWFGTVDSPEQLYKLLAVYDLESVLDAKMAPQSKIDELPRNYHMGAMDVRSGDMPSFGFRREHIPGTVRLEDWAKNRGMNLRELAKARPEA